MPAYQVGYIPNVEKPGGEHAVAATSKCHAVDRLAEKRCVDSNRNHTKRRLVEIEALRGVAILMVLVEHTPLNLFHWLSSFYGVMLHYWRGAAGVDLFFAISGFVITRSLAPDLLSQPASPRWRVVAAFWLRRFWRLIPAAWLWVAIPLLLTWLFNRSGAFRSLHANAQPALAAVLNVANIYLGLFWPSHNPGITSPYWSLSLEEQFYLLLPALLLILRRRAIWLMLGLVAYQFFSPATTLAVLTRPGAIAAGVALGLLQGERACHVAAAWRLPAARTWLSHVVLLVSVVASGALLGSELGLPSGPSWGLEALLSGALVLAASLDRGYVLNDGVVRRALVWMGARSYSFYLSHLPSYALAREVAYRMGLPGQAHGTGAVLLLLSLAVPTTILSAVVTYRFVEQPLRLHGRRSAARVQGGFDEASVQSKSRR